jgi:hypothetical protein
MRAIYTIIFLVGVIIGFGQNTNAFNFQSNLFDDNGVLVTLTPISLEASILDASGQVQYQEKHDLRTQSNGYFSIDIDCLNVIQN